MVGTSAWSRSTWVTDTKGQAYVAYFLEQAMKSGLVENRARHDEGAVALVGEVNATGLQWRARSSATRIATG